MKEKVLCGCVFGIVLAVASALPKSVTGACQRKNGEVSACLRGDVVQKKCVPQNCETSFKGTSYRFCFSVPSGITEVKANGDARILNQEIGNGVASILLAGIHKDSGCHLSFFENEKSVDTVTLYFAGYDDRIFSSSLSMENARTSAGLGIGYEIAEYSEENESTDSADGDSFGSAAGPNKIGASGKVTGVLKWKDQQGNEHPLVGAKVKLSIGGATWTKTAYTGFDGSYSLSYAKIWYVGNGHPKITIYPESALCCVVPKLGKTYSYSREFVYGGSNTFSYTFSPVTDGQLGQAMMVYQGAHLYAMQAEYLNGRNALTKCTVVYGSSNGTNEEKTYYSSDKNYIKLAYHNDSGPCPTNYAAWDVLGHEFGHHVQWYFGIGNNTGGDHYINWNLIDQYVVDNNLGAATQEAKKNGMKLAWNEAWPTYWSTVAQKKFPNEFKNIYTVGDDNYTESSFSYSLKTETEFFGDAHELASQSILYKLYSPEIDGYDQFSLGEDSLWNIVKNKKPQTFSEFIAYVYEENLCDKFKLGRLLEECNIAPLITISHEATMPYWLKLTWSTYMGSSYLRANEFDVCMSMDGGATIAHHATVTASGLTASYSVPLFWEPLTLPNLKRTAYFFVISKQTSFFTTGGYYSPLAEYSWTDVPVVNPPISPVN